MNYRNAQLRVARQVKQQIRDLRRARGWTQKELAIRAKMKPNAITRVEKKDDRLFTMRTLIKLANAFGVPLTIKFGK